MSHTPGPWHAHEDRVEFEPGFFIPTMVIHNSGCAIPNSREDFELMAAAPDLLSALKGIMAHYRFIENGLDFPDAWAAIQKAEGRS